jgi:hypothetical protein
VLTHARPRTPSERAWRSPAGTSKEKARVPSWPRVSTFASSRSARVSRFARASSPSWQARRGPRLRSRSRSSWTHRSPAPRPSASSRRCVRARRTFVEQPPRRLRRGRCASGWRCVRALWKVSSSSKTRTARRRGEASRASRARPWSPGLPSWPPSRSTRRRRPRRACQAQGRCVAAPLLSGCIAQEVTGCDCQGQTLTWTSPRHVKEPPGARQAT